MKVQNFELHFLEGGGVGRGQEGQINKYVWEYDEIMIFFTFCGVISINLALFYGQGTGVAKFQIFLGCA